MEKLTTKQHFDGLQKLYEAYLRPGVCVNQTGGRVAPTQGNSHVPPWLNRAPDSVPIIERADFPVLPAKGSVFGSDNQGSGETIVFDDGEVVASTSIAEAVVDHITSPSCVPGSSFNQVEKEAPNEGASEVNRMTDQNTKTEPPVHKITAGSINVAVWANPGLHGGTFYSVTWKRSYRKKDGDWGDSHALRVNDIHRLISALQKAFDWIAVGRHGIEVESDRNDLPQVDATSSVSPAEPAGKATTG